MPRTKIRYLSEQCRQKTLGKSGVGIQNVSVQKCSIFKNSLHSIQPILSINNSHLTFPAIHFFQHNINCYLHDCSFLYLIQYAPGILFNFFFSFFASPNIINAKTFLFTYIMITYHVYNIMKFTSLQCASQIWTQNIPNYKQSSPKQYRVHSIITPLVLRLNSKQSKLRPNKLQKNVI